jgi:hypothetical protein
LKVKMIIYTVAMDRYVPTHIREFVPRGWCAEIEALLATNDNRLIVASPPNTGKSEFGMYLELRKDWTDIETDGTLNQTVRWIVRRGVGNGLVYDLTYSMPRSSMSTLKRLLKQITDQGRICTRSGKELEIAQDVPILILTCPHHLSRLSDLSPPCRIINTHAVPEASTLTGTVW